MPAKLVPTVRTTYSEKEIVKGLIEGWIEAFGTTPSKESIGVIRAQNGIETSSNNCWNNNIGNVKFVSNETSEAENQEFMYLKNVWEILNGQKVVFQPPHPATAFRSFPTLKDGIAHHLNLLKHGRYKKAWVDIEAGSVSNFAITLKNARYYTANVADYISGMNSFYKKYMESDLYEIAIEEIAAGKINNPFFPALVYDGFPDKDELEEDLPPIQKSTWQKIKEKLFF